MGLVVYEDSPKALSLSDRGLCRLPLVVKVWHHPLYKKQRTMGAFNVLPYVLLQQRHIEKLTLKGKQHREKRYLSVVAYLPPRWRLRVKRTQKLPKPVNQHCHIVFKGTIKRAPAIVLHPVRRVKPQGNT